MKFKGIVFNRQTIHRLWHAVEIFLQSPDGRRAKLLSAMLLTLLFCITGLNVVNSFVARNFMSAIEVRDHDGFAFYAWIYAGVFALSTMTAVFFRYTEERLGLLWRNSLTRRIVEVYLDRKLYFTLPENGPVTNPDQRIADDVRALTSTTLSFFLMILNSTITVISFAGVLWVISPTLFGVSVLYAAVGSGATILLGKLLIPLNYRQADLEADFRAELIHLRKDAIDIISNGQEASARERLMSRLDLLIGNLNGIIVVNRNLSFFTTGYNYMIQLIPILLVAPIFIKNGVEFGIIGQAAMAFATMVGAFSLIVTQFNSISAYASVITRLGEFVEAAEASHWRT